MGITGFKILINKHITFRKNAKRGIKTFFEGLKKRKNKFSEFGYDHYICSVK
jgi:hypothetical protein